MKINNLIKFIPILSTLLILIFLSITNQKQYTKLKILIWNTPSLSLGTYLAISTGTGCLISYIITSNLTKVSKSKIAYKIKYEPNTQSDLNNSYQETNNQTLYENTLIERDIKDPSPTLKASFRVIGKTNKKLETINNNDENEYVNSDLLDDSKYNYDDDEFNNISDQKFNTLLNDWEDDTYSNW